ncbi:MAG: DegT/DnrJ/EryC1/StrS family aminotransferase [Gaiellaceae bacterium]
MIPVSEPLLGELEAEYALECIRTGWISSEGAWVGRFESAWASYCGVEHGVAVSSGTAALFAAAAAVDLGPGDEVIMPTFTIISCAHAVVATGATPVLVDSEPDTWCLAVEQIADRITDRTRAIMPVHMYGHPVDMDPIWKLASKHGLAVLEDAAEAHGARYRGRPAGSLGDLACFSFYANKIITTGEGGMVVTSDSSLAEKVRSYVNLGFRPERRFYHTEVGYNHRLTSVQAAIGLGQLADIDRRVERKREIGRRYVSLLSDIEGLALPVEMPWALNVYWMVGIVVDEAIHRIGASELSARLAERGISTRPFFLGMHEQPVFHRQGLFEGERYPIAETLGRSGIYLPSGVGLSDSDVDRVSEAVHECLEVV